MKRTSVLTVTVSVVVGVTLGYLGNVVLAALGRAVLIPPLSMALTLLVLAVAVVALAWPVRAAVKGTAKRPINPLVASRTAVLAKSSSLSGALLTGVAAGIGYFLLTRSVVPGGDSTLPTLAALVGGAALLIAGLVAEAMCTLPPDEPHAEGAVGA